VRVLIAYDVSTTSPEGAKRLRRVARACQDYGQRVQYSLFECHLGTLEWAMLHDRLLSEVKETEDSLRFYFLEEDTRIEHHGVREPIALDGPLII